MSNENYQQMVARMRAERANRETVERVQEITRDYQETVRSRDEAAARGDVESFEMYDDDAQRLEQDYAAIAPPQQPQADPRLVQFGQLNQDYFNKLRARVGPQRAQQFLDWVDQRLVNMGIQRHSPAYFERGRDMLELDSARVTGVSYDPKSESLTADEAAKISLGNSKYHRKRDAAETYNRASQQLFNQGRFSFQQK
jgi:hypothetical protein